LKGSCYSTGYCLVEVAVTFYDHHVFDRSVW